MMNSKHSKESKKPSRNETITDTKHLDSERPVHVPNVTHRDSLHLPNVEPRRDSNPYLENE